MPRVPLPMPMRAGVAKSRFVSSQTLINCYVEIDRDGRPAIYGGPGLTLALECGLGPIRGLHKFGDTLLVVSGQELYTVTSGLAATLRGPILGTDTVCMANNGLEAVIVAEAASTTYVWDGATLSTITDADFLGASSVDFLDQYLVFTKPESQQFFISALADATSYDATEVASAEADPDNIRRVIVDNREALFMGERSVEGWVNDGNPDFPLVRGTTFLECGLAARDAVAKIDQTVFWLAEDGTIRALRGGSPQIVSDHDTATFIATWEDRSATVAMAFRFRGHSFFVLRNPDGCILLDAATNLPHIRKSDGLDTWRCVNAVEIWGTTYFGDHDSGKVYELDEAAHDEAGEPLVRQIVTRTLSPSGTPFTLDEFEVGVEVGVGIASGQGSAPVVWAEASRDSGETFGARVERLLGATGDREKRIVWEDWGQFPPHGACLRIGCSDPVRFVVTDGAATFTPDNP